MALDRIWGNLEKVVVLDTSAILMLFEFSINIDDEISRLIGKHKIIIPNFVVEELKTLLNKGKGKQKRLAKASIQLINKYEISEFNSKKNTDDAIVEYSKQIKCFVVTNDKELRKKLKNQNTNVIFLRNKKKLEIE